MPQRVVSSMKQLAPWRKAIPWWIVLIEGLLAFALGIYFTAQGQQARQTLLLVVGGYLAVTGFLNIAVGLRRPKERSGPAQLLVVQGIVGAVIGTFAILQYFQHLLPEDGIRFVLAIGFLLSGLISLYAAFTRSGEGGRALGGGLLFGLFNVILAILLFTFPGGSTVMLTWIGWFFIIGGILLVVYAILLYGAKRSSAATSG